jgi:uncharacterized membrane protein
MSVFLGFHLTTFAFLWYHRETCPYILDHQFVELFFWHFLYFFAIGVMAFLFPLLAQANNQKKANVIGATKYE